MTETDQPLFYELTARVLEDLHTGTGTGQGDIDTLIMRDRTGLHPVIRASHLAGLLRLTGEELIKLGVLKAGELDALLGASGVKKSQLRMTSLRTNTAITTPQLWGSTRIVSGKRHPQEDTLRLIEYVPVGTEFTATLRLPNKSTVALLERLLRRIDRIGGGRNRGAGLVQLGWQSSTRWGTQPETEDSPATHPGISQKATRLHLLLRNLEPLCLPLTGYPGNLILTQSFIPGQTLRGAFMAWAIAQGNSAFVNTDEFRKISFGDALPLPLPGKNENCVRSVMPIPLSLMRKKPKSAGGELPWWAGNGESIEVRDTLCERKSNDDSNNQEEKLKRPSAHEYICTLKAGEEREEWQRYAPEITIALRNQSADTAQDKTELFSLEEIAEETCFQAELRFENNELLTRFVESFAKVLKAQDWLAVGRGGQPVSIAAVQADSAAEAVPAGCGEGFTLTLTSDAIVRGPYLGFLSDLTIEHLCRLADIPVPANCKIEKTKIVETTVIHGFNAVSGLRRSAALALRRGSCWWITGEDSNQLAQLLQKIPALGERIQEGYGRFAINVQPVQLGMPEAKNSPLSVNQQENRLACAKKLVTDWKEDKKPSDSQLQWLRNQALACDDASSFSGLLEAIKDIPEKRPKSGEVWQKFPSEKVESALKKFEDLNEKKLLIANFMEYMLPGNKQKGENK